MSMMNPMNFPVFSLRSLLPALALLFAPALSSAGELRGGAALVDITPEPGVSMAGTISQNKPVTKIHDPLHVRALALDDGETRLAFAVVDSTMVSDSIMDEAKRLIEERTGLPGAQVMISATHTHSTPRAVAGLVEDEKFDTYLEGLPGAIARAVASALERAEPASAALASLEAPEHVHNRRWFVEESDRLPAPFTGKREEVRMNPGKAGLIKPAGPVDPELTLLSLRNAEGKPLAVLGNYGLHYVGGTGAGNVSADYFAVFSRAVGRGLYAGEDFVGIMSNGTSGDVNNIDFTKPRERREPFEKMTEVGEDLASRAVSVIGEAEHRDGLALAAAETVLELAVRKPSAERLAWAKETAVPDNSPLRKTRPQIYAREALKLAEYPDTVPVRIQAFRIGDWGVASIPCEVFAETGLAIKEGSPFADTFVIELANGYHGYLPTAEQHEWGGYETWPARSAYLEPEAETKIRAAALELLEELAKE